jgi:4-amino-4-deoxy-L-arabinose transferase-like glycosyltransferase
MRQGSLCVPGEMHMHIFLSKNKRNWIWGVIAVAAVVRLITLGSYPLTDNTEARYAEVAREMVSTGNWVSPQLHGQKFWAKPPLSIWATALGLKVFGENEFAARFPHLVFSLLTILLVYTIARKQKGSESARMASLVLITSCSFFIASSAVMTDAALLFGTTLSMVAFWRALAEGERFRRLWGYLFFIGLAIGLLAKGPVGLVLTFPPIGIWVIWKKQWRAFLLKLPWISGLLLTGALSLPWYFAAETRTPGFLEYFIIGEHWHRFLTPGWGGDMYGSAHSQPRGTICLMWIMAAFPWSLIAIGAWLKNVKKYRKSISYFRSEIDDWRAYLLLWAVFPMLLFSFAGNILWTYVLPGMPAFALIVADVRHMIFPSFSKNKVPHDWRRHMAGPAAGLIVPVFFGLMIFIWSFIPYKGSQKYLISQYRELRPEKTNRLIYLQTRPYSAEFYLSGNALEVIDPGRVATYLKDDIPDFYVVKQSRLCVLPATLKNRLLPLGLYDGYILLSEETNGKKAVRVLAEK